MTTTALPRRAPWTEDETARALAWVRAHGVNLHGLAAHMGETYNAVRNRVHGTLAVEYRAAVAAWQADAAVARVTERDGAAVAVSAPGPTIRTLDDLLAAAQVDLTRWQVARYVVNKWEVGSKRPDTGAVVTAPLFQVKAWLEPLPGASVVDALRTALLTDLRAAAPRVEAPALVRHVGDRLLLEVAPVDAHFGKLAWAPETGEHYDLSIAEAAFTDAIETTLARAAAQPVHRTALIVGNDLLQADNPDGTTTAGTRVDTDSRFVRTFRRAVALQAWAARRLAAVAPVRLIIVPGNHDSQSAFHVGEVLEAMFAHDRRVEIDNTVRPRKYLRYGTTLLGFCHGHREKHARLPMLMATERPKLWAAATHREIHLGHLHTMRETAFRAGDTLDGVRVRILPALSATDAWHAAEGYVGSQRACESYLWEHATGYAGHISVGVARAAAAARVA